jgi:hypothetical protein
MAAPLAFNPQLPAVPAGVYTDPQYAADEADLRHNIMTQYQGILQQLGYTDDQGNYIPGIVETEAQRQRTDLARQLGLAQEGVTNRAQQQGTYFSGRHADELAKAEFPIRTAQSQLEEDVPRNMANLYDQATSSLTGYATGRNSLLAQAAGRYEPPGIAAVPDPATAIAAGAAGQGADPGAASISHLGPAAPNANAAAYAKTQLRKMVGLHLIPQKYGLPGEDVTATYRRLSPKLGAYRTAHPLPKMAEGGVVDQPTVAQIGEAGPEAVIPLSDGLESAIARLIQAYQEGGGDAQQQGAPTGKGNKKKKAANVKAVGLKAAARILSEAAKEHEDAAPDQGGDQGQALTPEEQQAMMQQQPPLTAAPMVGPDGVQPPDRPFTQGLPPLDGGFNG